MDSNGVFLQEVIAGLGSNPKKISSRFFYDDEGSKIFREIMEMPEYYLTKAELDIFQKHAGSIVDALFIDKSNKNVVIVELGAGDGSKTKLLLQACISQGLEVTYHPIDVSEKAIDFLMTNLSAFKDLIALKPIIGNYNVELGNLKLGQEQALAVLFLGSNVGNYMHSETIALFNSISKIIGNFGRLMVGFDLAKEPNRILAAYNDAKGVTARFNINLLHRMKRELNANLNVHDFMHFPVYDPSAEEAKSYLIAIRDTAIKIPEGGLNFELKAWETIQTEVSRKYSVSQMASIGAETGFETCQAFVDESRDFAEIIFANRR